MSNSDTLEALRAELALWRSKSKKSSRIPLELWDKIIKLYPMYTVNQICRRLKLHHTQVKNKLKKNDPFTLKTDTPFCEIAMPATTHQHGDAGGVTCELQRIDGNCLTVKHLSYPVLEKLITTFMGDK